MPREDVFDGLHLDNDPDRTVYEEADLGYDTKAMKEFVSEFYMNESFKVANTKEFVAQVRMREEEMESKLSEIITEDFEAQPFLDELIGEVGRTSSNVEYSHLFFDPLVNALHTLGYNDLELDLRRLGAEIDAVGPYVRGTVENPLKVRYRVHTANNLATLTKFAEISFHGNSSVVGFAMRDSDLTLYGTCSFIALAQGATDSSFRIKDFDLSKFAPTFTMRTFSEKSVVDLLRDWFKEAAFWMRGNTLYLMDENEEWYEVKPE